MKKALLLLLFVSGLAYGQMDDCEKTLVFEETFDFNETKFKYDYKDRYLRIMADHKLTIRAWTTNKTGLLIEEYTAVFGDNDSELFNNRSQFIMGVLPDDELIYNLDALRKIYIITDVECPGEKIISRIVIDLRNNFGEKTNVHKFIDDVEREVLKHFKSEERAKYLPRVNCTSNTSSSTVNICLDGVLREIENVAFCN